MQTFAPWHPDASQQKILDLKSGKHLVLAPPGCGKTQILAERISLALADGVKPEDMLCLTFTNRAARGMRERINERVGEKETEDVFVGNVHRFCSRFLFTNGIVPAESAIIDDDTTDSILARYLNEDEDLVKRDFRRKRAHAQIMFFSHLMYDIIHGVSKELRIHPECVTPEDIATLKAIAKATDKPFDAKLMIDVYDHTDYYLDLINQPVFPTTLKYEAEQSLMKMRYAHAYTAYKNQNNLLDFEDLLQLTYSALKSDSSFKRYPWIQVDEVQDLNMLQVAIIEELASPLAPPPQGGEGIYLFLGDEQQAIFSFMGAKLETLNILKDKCKGHIHHLNVNHRQPQQIVQMLNDYAIANLHSDASLLPAPTEDKDDKKVEMHICPTENIWAEYKSVAKRTKGLLKEKDTTTAIIVNSNRDADEISNNLEAAGIPHFKISGTDLFSTPELKLLTAHLSVLNNELNNLAWAQIMQGMKVCGSAATARQFVHRLRKVAIAPTDLLHKDDTYLEQFLHTYENSDLIVFDTETTGLNVYDDDIIQIAAERIHQGKSVAKFSVYLQTDRSIPKMLGDIENPIIEERRHNELLTPAEGLQAFLGFAKGCPLLAHNASFDYHIMDFCIQRTLPDTDWLTLHPVCFDSLKLIRLLRPDLKVYKLKALLAELGLQGENSHLADDDVNATVSLVNYCYTKGLKMKPTQEAFLQQPNTKKMAERLRRNYGADYEKAVNKLYLRPSSTSKETAPALVNELQRFYNSLIDGRWIKPIEKISYVFSFLTEDVIHPDEEPSLKEQLDNHIMEISTFKEADLCGSTSIKERVFVSTIHKAKGLEFDNVIVFDVVDGRIPNIHDENNSKLLEEDARKLYVALSRAKKRIYVYYSKNPPTTNIQRTQKLSRFMKPVMKYFTS
jgi:DNA helicase-2/ATP-dependent DNA helicase PcrA